MENWILNVNALRKNYGKLDFECKRASEKIIRRHILDRSKIIINDRILISEAIGCILLSQTVLFAAFINS